MALEQPFLKETPGAQDEILKDRFCSFVSLHWSAFCIQKILSKSEFAQVAVINLPCMHSLLS